MPGAVQHNRRERRPLRSPPQCLDRTAGAARRRHQAGAVVHRCRQQGRDNRRGGVHHQRPLSRSRHPHRDRCPPNRHRQADDQQAAHRVRQQRAERRGADCNLVAAARLYGKRPPRRRCRRPHGRRRAAPRHFLRRAALRAGGPRADATGRCPPPQGKDQRRRAVGRVSPAQADLEAPRIYRLRRSRPDFGQSLPARHRCHSRDCAATATAMVVRSTCRRCSRHRRAGLRCTRVRSRPGLAHLCRQAVAPGPCPGP